MNFLQQMILVVESEIIQFYSTSQSKLIKKSERINFAVDNNRTASMDFFFCYPRYCSIPESLSFVYLV